MHLSASLLYLKGSCIRIHVLNGNYVDSWAWKRPYERLEKKDNFRLRRHSGPIHHSMG